VLAATRSGGVCFNDTVSHILGEHCPSGPGRKRPWGTYHGKASFDAFTHYRSVLPPVIPV